MARKDLHDQPFNEETIAKLEIFEDYAQAWLPVFVMKGAPTILIADFFAGTGYDKNDVPGSPIRILEKVWEQEANIRKRGIRIIVYFNEFNKRKFDRLSVACQNFISEHHGIDDLIDLQLSNQDFEVAFSDCLPGITAFPSLVYLDQNGIKYLSPKYFLKLEKVKQCDFLYFIAASYIWRFGSTNEFQLHLNIDLEDAKRNPYRFIHRSVLGQLKESLPELTKLKLYPFTIRKGSNIYGIIFGAKHLLAVDKFINIAWKRDRISGEANFDINEEAKKDQLALFEAPALKKVEAFQARVEQMVLNGDITNNVDLYEFALREAHPGSHAADVLRRLKREKRVTYSSSSPLVSYEAYKKGRKMIYEVL